MSDTLSFVPSVAAALRRLRSSSAATHSEPPTATAFFTAAAQLADHVGSGRSAALLLEQIKAVRDTPLWMRELRREPWTTRRFGLLDLACATARELVADGRVTVADWLAAQILVADPDIRRAYEVRALVAVESHRPMRARRHYARCIEREANAPEAKRWLRAQHARMAARAVFTELAGHVDAPAGGAVDLWQAALSSGDTDRRDRLQALAVAEACRPGDVHDAALWCRRYLLERSADPATVTSIARRLDAAEEELRTMTHGAPSSSRAVPPRPAAPWPRGGSDTDTVIALHLTSPRAERDLPGSLAEARAALAETDRAADLVVVHGALDPVTITAAVEVAPEVHFVQGDVRRWSGLPVGTPIARGLLALDALRLSGYGHVLLAPASAGVGAHLVTALRDARDGTVSATALRDDVVKATNLVAIDAPLTGDDIVGALDIAALQEFGVDRFRDTGANTAWRVLTAMRDALVADGAVSLSTGFTGYSAGQAATGVDDDVELMNRVIAQPDSHAVCELLEREITQPYQLTDRVLFRWALALHASGRSERALGVLAACNDRDDADPAAASIAWVLDDKARTAEYDRALQARRRDHQ